MAPSHVFYPAHSRSASTSTSSSTSSRNSSIDMPSHVTSSLSDAKTTSSSTKSSTITSTSATHIEPEYTYSFYSSSFESSPAWCSDLQMLQQQRESFSFYCDHCEKNGSSRNASGSKDDHVHDVSPAVIEIQDEDLCFRGKSLARLHEEEGARRW